MSHGLGKKLIPFDPGWAAGDERLPFGLAVWADATPSTTAHVAGFLFFTPHPLVLAGVNMSLTTGQTGAEARAGIYTNNGRGRPGVLVQDLGTLDLSATTGKRTWAATCMVHGWFWALAWLKNVATQATVRCTSTNAFGAVHPLPSAQLAGGTNGSRGLYLADTYPASMPAAAPALAAHNNANVMVLTVTAA